MSPAAMAAVLALSEANRALKRARIAFVQMGDRETAKVLTHTIDENDVVMEALICQQRKTRPLGVAS